MAFDTRRTYLCYENRDLIRDGYIPTYSLKGYVPVSSFNQNRLKNPPKGVSYILEWVLNDKGEKVLDSNGKPILKSVIEKKRLLSATKIQLEIDFSKVMRNAVTNPFKPGSIIGTPFGDMIAGNLLSNIGFGGLTSGTSEITFQILEAQTKINRVIVVDDNIIKDEGWYCEDGYPLSVFGIVKEHIENVTTGGKTTPTPTGKGLNFSSSDLENLGKFSSGTWQGSARKRIVGATDSNGLYGGRGDPEVKFSKVKYSDQEQLFVKIVRDSRTLKFRADNFDSPSNQSFPPGLESETAVDATDRFIRIKTSGSGWKLSVGDKLYITYSVCSERFVRQNIVHKGTVAQGNTFGISGFIGAIDSKVDAFDYQLCTWKVPQLPSSISYYNIDSIDTGQYPYKIDPRKYYDIVLHNKQTGFSEITGWRVSESITPKVKKFWAADYRGILLYDYGSVTILLSADKIIDQDWFYSYLRSLDFIAPTGPLDPSGNPTYLKKDYEKKIEDHIDFKEISGFLFDLNVSSNSLCFDREKIPYYRPFAESLKYVSKYDGVEKNGVGIIHLDLLSSFSTLERDPKELTFFDLSFSVFRNTNSQTSLIYQCENPMQIHSYDYSSNNYDAENEGPGTWYSADYIANKAVYEWRPGGGTIEGYWKVITPYFCGDFSRNTRVYIEKMGGNSLDNYSWIYVNTTPFVPTNISLDKNYYTGESVLVFKDDFVHNGISYYKFLDALYSSYYNKMKIDYNISPLIDTFNHNDDLILGQNKLLGLFPSYSSGKPVSEEVPRVCRTENNSTFWWTEDLLNLTTNISGIDYGLSFDSNPPKAAIPSSMYVKKLHIEYRYKYSYSSTAPSVPEDDTWVSLYFEGTNTSISNINLYSTNVDQETGFVKIDIDTGYYNGGPLHFLGNFWKYIDVVYVYARVTSPSISGSKNTLNLEDYKIPEDQSSIVYDQLGRMFVFYGNSESGNIDVAVSMNNGSTWLIHKNIIRLIENETAASPFAFKDYNAGYVHLFYVLNGSFIMYKRIATDLFNEDDAFVEQKVPKSYKVGDYDTTKSGSEASWWGNLSESGQMIRRMPSYFVVGDAEDPYFIEQNSIKDDLRLSNLRVSDQSLIQHPRFEYAGNLENLNDKEYNDSSSFTVHVDNSGVVRLFYTSFDGNLYIKRSDDYFMWIYDVQDQEIHRIFKDDKQNEGFSSEIQNIQVIRDNYDPLTISLLYFNNGMMFIRHFNSNLLFPTYDPEGNRDSSNTKKEMELTSESTNKPIFIVGNMLSEIKNTKVQEINDKVSDEDSALLIKIPYGVDVINKMDDQLAIDTDTQPVGMVLDSGLIRVFYRDNVSNIRSISINRMEQPVLEMFWKRES